MDTTSRPHRRGIVVLLALLVVSVPLGASTTEAHRGRAPGPPAGRPAGIPHEVWMLDQGTDLIHVLDRDGGTVAVIDVGPEALAGRGFAHVPPGPATVPHMIDFDSEHRFAFVAATAGQATIVIDADAKEVVEVLPTGPGSHMAAVTPDDTSVWVAVLGDTDLVEIAVDLEVPSFEIAARLDVGALLAPIEAQHPEWRSNDPGADPDADFSYASYAPVCQQFSPDGREAWVTLGPGWHQGGLFVLDLLRHQVTAAWNPAEVKANCGIDVSPDGRRAAAGWSGRVVPGADTEGEWYVFETDTKELLRAGSTRGLDGHGLRFTPDGRRLWAVNRNTGNALVVDARTFRVVRALDDLFDAPDIIDLSPDGRLLYVSQRGPHPLSGAVHAAAGDQPGVAVVHAPSGRLLRVLEPPTVVVDGVVRNDVHGVAVRRLDR